MSKITNFTEGKIYFPLIKFAIPIILAMFLQTMYGAVDVLIISMFAESSDISAVSTASQAMMFVQAVIIGLSAGISILLGQKIGEGKIDDAGKVIGSSISILFVVSVLFTLTFLIFSTDIVRILNVPSEALDAAVSYISICGGGTVFIVAYNLLGSVFRGLGDSKTPLMTVAIACVTNIVLDLLFVAVFKMAATGAAIATILAQAISVVLSLYVVSRKGLPVKFTLKDIRFHKEETKRLLTFGTPMAVQDGLVNISFLAVLAIINSLGVVASAGLGITSRLIGFMFLVPASFTQALGAFVAQNYGACSMERAKRALLYTIGTIALLSSIASYFSYFHGDILLSLFTSDMEVLNAGWESLRAYAIDVFLLAFLFPLLGYFIGCGRTPFVMFQGIFGAFFVRIPASYIISLQEGAGLFHISLATPLATIVQIVLSVIYFGFLAKHIKQRCSVPQIQTQ